MRRQTREEFVEGELATLEDAARVMFQDYKFHRSRASQEQQDLWWDGLPERTKERWRNVASRWLS